MNENKENLNNLYSIISSINDKYTNKLKGSADVFPLSNKPFFNPLVPLPSPYEAQYQLMRRLAEEEDNFERIVNVFADIIKKELRKRETSSSMYDIRYKSSLDDLCTETPDIKKAKEVLSAAHKTYIHTQRQLAQAFAEQGLFELADAHLKNAHTGAKIQIDYVTVTLEPTVEEGLVETVVNTAIRNTSLGYFLKKVKDASDQGNVEQIQKYIALSMKSMLMHGLIAVPHSRKHDEEENGGHTQSRNEKYAAFLEAQYTFHKLHRRAFAIAICKKLEDGLKYGLSDTYNQWNVDYGLRDIERARKEVLDLILRTAKDTCADQGRDKFVGNAVNYFNVIIEPLFEMMAECRKDPNHPLRTMYSLEKDNIGLIKGVKRTESNSTALVPQRFYEEQCASTGLPLLIHPFYAPVVERYYHIN